MKFYTSYLACTILFLGSLSCSFKGVQRSKEITYMEKGLLENLPEKQLNVFSPNKANGKNPVMLFIHGGSWNSGNKEIYNFLGSRLARKGIVAVIIDYPLSPDFQVHDMAKASAQAVKWTEENINTYGGNPERIFVSGHSAGGHLASLISVRDEYFDTLGAENPIKGTILIDAAGLDMYWFLKEMNYEPGTKYLRAFTDDPQVWKDTSPIYFLDEKDPPMLIMMGGRTLPGIEKTTERFLEEYKKIKPEPNFHLQKKKKHIPMIAQFIYTPNKVYKWIEEFMWDK
ncbi:alpha/beta hydrolase [Mongoliibacter ruber]|uniref:Alpha/beta hydrolase family protein n=1 Tax=Mongoliibacter ruber TaxID=1750599 RepID=A0A2T0WIP1_9BACT|nr:alpha/beta hydrolase [Mongoliibacter ruber]PRY86525.1 alpha/beta hydrolase family protein [Mongoliibacter ruber]